MVPRVFSVVLLLHTATAAPHTGGSSTNNNNGNVLTLDQASSATVHPKHWIDFAVLTPSLGPAELEGATLAFEVDAETTSPTGIGVYVFDGASHDADANFAPTLHPGSDGTIHGASPPKGARAIDVDSVSHIGTPFTSRRKYFAYVGSCYLSPGTFYFLSVYGSGSLPVSFTVKAKLVPAKVALGGTTEASVCDGKYMHHYFDVPTVPGVGGYQISARKTGGELDSMYLRYERCATGSAAGATSAQSAVSLFGGSSSSSSSTGGSGSSVEEGAGSGSLSSAKAGVTNLAHRNLHSHGFATASVMLPSVTADGEELKLLPGRYYVAVRGLSELCGSYTLNINQIGSGGAYLAASEGSG